MDLTNNSALQATRERMREKMNGTLKTAKLQTSLASKIKSKNFNNSSVVKISLKHNNRALACALTAEKETSRRLESEKMILQKEVKMLHFQNALLRENLSRMNRMLKDIDAFMNINLPAVIELSSIGESSDLFATEDRFSQESRFSVDGFQGFRLTGVALRVPSSSIEQQKCSNDPGVLLNEDEHLIAPQSTDSSTVKERFDGQQEIEMHTSLLPAKDHLSTCNTNVTWNSSLNMEVNPVLPLEEDMISNGKSGGFVTQRRKRSTASFSSTHSLNSDFNPSKNSLGIGRESSTQWRIDHPGNLSPEPGHSGVTGENALYFDFVMKKDMLDMSCSPLSNQDNFDAKKENKDTQLDMATTHQPDLVHSGGCNLQPIVERPVEQEKTVYEADMEITSSDSAAIVAVMPKRKTKTSKSSIPVKPDGTSLRKVRITAPDKTKRRSSCKGKESSMTSKSEVKMKVPSNTDENIPLEFKPSADFRQDSADQCNSRRTYVLPGPAMNDKTKVFESKTKPYNAKYQAKPSVACSVEESFVENDENITLEIQPPADIEQDAADQYNNRRTYVLPGPVNKTKICESKTKLYLGKNEAKPSVVCSVQESFTETTYLCDANSDLISAVENLPSSDVEHSTNDMAVKRRKSKLGKRPAKDIVNSKKKRKKNTNLGEAQDSHMSNELDSDKMDTTATFQIKNQPCTRRETYVLSSSKPNCVLSEFIPKDDETNCRRETFVIPEPNRLISVSEENAETPDYPLQTLKSAVSKDVQLRTEGVIDAKKTDSNIDSHDLDTDFKKPRGVRKSKCKTNQNKKSLNLFSQVDKRKTRVLATNQNDLSNNKDALVRESCVNATQFHSNKPTKLLNAVTENEHDSFMLDMVSESILDGTLDCPSFAEFPSTTNPETASMYNVSLNNIPLLDPPVSDERDTTENKKLNASKSLDVFDENGLAEETFEVENQQCKIENQSIEINEADVKPFQDLTNKTLDLTKQSSKSCSEDQEEAQVHTRRRRNPVNYKEPSLGVKLRCDTESLKSSAAKGKGGRKGGSKKKKIKSEEGPTQSL